MITTVPPTAGGGAPRSSSSRPSASATKNQPPNAIRTGINGDRGAGSAVLFISIGACSLSVRESYHTIYHHLSSTLQEPPDRAGSARLPGGRSRSFRQRARCISFRRSAAAPGNENEAEPSDVLRLIIHGECPGGEQAFPTQQGGSTLLRPSSAARSSCTATEHGSHHRSSSRWPSTA